MGGGILKWSGLKLQVPLYVICTKKSVVLGQFLNWACGSGFHSVTVLDCALRRCAIVVRQFEARQRVVTFTLSSPILT